MCPHQRKPWSINLLLDFGADIDALDSTGQTALMMACWQNKPQCVQALCNRGADIDILSNGAGALRYALMYGNTECAQIIQVWPVLSRLMAATVMRQHGIVWELLHSGEDPTVIVQHQGHSLSALFLATENEVTGNWAAPVCTKTLHLIEKSLQWSPYDLKAHVLFPPSFRRGVRHVLGLMVALDNNGRGLPHHIWMLIIACLPRTWGLRIARALLH